jgi:ABC-type branched-subunit amino acid transport system ATPase component
MTDYEYRIPRLQMFAGPNGSGKSTLYSVISEDLLGVYINPDDIEREIKQFNFLDLREYGVDTTTENILTFFANSTLLEKAELQDESDSLSFSDDKLSFSSPNPIARSHFPLRIRESLRC